MEQFSRLFTPDEANELLDTLNPLVESLLAARQEILELRPSLEGALNKAISNGGSLATGDVLEAFQRLRSALNSIQAHDVLVKDINSGLIDFPSERDGGVVFLCWRYGEVSVTHWHDLDAGYAGRQPI